LSRSRRTALPLLAALVLAPIAVPVVVATEPTVVVQPGDTLIGISKRIGVPVARLLELNTLADPNRIFAGQRLRIAAPAPAATPARAAAPGSAPATSVARTHTVAAGEHLTGIARRYGVTIAAIVNANRLTNASRIYAGQRLTIPAAAAPAAAARPAPGSSTAAMPPSMAALVEKRDAVRQLIVGEAARYRVPAAFALAVAWQESGWQQHVVSGAGAIGVMQLMPDTADWVGEAMLGSAVDPADVRQNVRAGVRLLAHYLDRYDGNRGLVLAAYYQGQSATDRHGIYPVSRPYIASISVLVTLFGG
jgi:N-acetylmuramoyl-L-alanine amidase